MIKQRFALSSLCALFTSVMAMSPLIGCSAPADANNTSSTDESSEQDFTAASMGLWTLDGAPQTGDIEILQLGARNYASLAHQPAAPRHAANHAPAGAAAAPAQPTIIDPSTYGDLWRGGAAVSLHATAAATTAAVDAEPTYTANVSTAGDTLTLTSSTGRVLTYQRSYNLYCVPTDRSIEATALVHMTKSPTVVGVNGDGVMFPSEGTYSASVRNDVLFQLRNYEIVSHTPGPNSKTITLKFAWSDMSKSMIDGTLSIVGGPSGIAPTPIQCERIAN